MLDGSKQKAEMQTLNSRNFSVAQDKGDYANNEHILWTRCSSCLAVYLCFQCAMLQPSPSQHHVLVEATNQLYKG